MRSIREARPFAIWAGVLVICLVAGELIEAAGAGWAAPVPIAGAGAVLIITQKNVRFLSALGSSLVLLLLARSVLAPGILSNTTPLWVAGLIMLALVLEFRKLALPRNFLLIALLALTLIVPTVFYGTSQDVVKSTGIAAMWIVVFFGAANLPATQRPKLYWTILVAGVVESVLAILETLFRFEWLRVFVVGSAAEGAYVVRPNLILGDWTNRAQGTVGYPIPFAAFIVIALVLLVVGGIIQSYRVKVGLALLFVVALLLSGSRSSFVALGLAVGIILLSILQQNRKRVSRRQVALMLGALAVAAVGAAFFGLRALQSNDFSLMHRGGVVESALNVFSLPLPRVLWGSGYNSAEGLFESGVLNTTGLEVVDNTLVTQLIYSGVFGLLIFIALIIVGFSGSRIAGRAALAALVAFFFFFDIFNWHLITFLLFLFIGLANAPVAARSGTITAWLPSWPATSAKGEKTSEPAVTRAI